MSTLIGSLFVSLTADFHPFQRNMRAAEGVVASTSGRMRRDLGLTVQSTERLRGAFNQSYRSRLFGESLRTITRTNDEVQRLRASFVALSAITGAGFTGALSGAYLIQTADRARLLTNQLRTVTDGSENLAAIQERLYDISQRSRSGLQATTTIYARTARATEHFGLSQEKLLRITETIQKAFAIGGATQAEAFGAAVQLSQGIASDRFSGEEFRSVAENAPVLLRGIAESLGVNIGKLREMAHAGELTAEVVTRAIIESSKRIDSEFEKTTATVAAGITRLDNAFLKYMGGVDAAYGVTENLAAGLTSLAENFENVAYWAGLALGGGIAAFVGRSAGNFARNRVVSVQRENAVRKENLRLAREELSTARRQQNEAKKALNEARATPAGGVGAVAPRSFASAVQREEAALSKIDAERLANTQKQIEARQRLGAVTVTASRTATRAADSLAASEAKLNSLRANSAELAKQEERARRAANVRFTSSTPGADAIDRRKQAEREVNRIVAERGRLAESITRQEADAAARRVTIANLGSEAERRAANERLAIRRQIIALDQQSVAIQQRADQQRSRLLAARGAQTTAGQDIQAQNVLGATRALDSTSAAVDRARERLTLAARAASGLATSLGVVRNVGASLVGFLGGPWGVAFTGAISLLAVFGARAARTAQELSLARQIISEELGELSSAAMSPNQERAILSDQILAASEKLRVVESRLENIKNEAIDIAATSFFSNLGGLTAAQTTIMEAAWAQVSKEIRNGETAVSDLGRRLSELGVHQNIVDAVVADIKDLITEGKSAEVVIDAINQRITELDGRRARVTIEVEVADPFGVFALAGPGNRGWTPNKEVEQRRIYGGAQNATRHQMNRIRQREAIAAELRRASKDPGQIIEDRAMQLMRDGLSGNRTEAKALASELIRLEDSAKKAGGAKKSAAKDAENFKNKLKELREQASAAFLSDLDRKVVDFAKSMKDGSALMKQYTDAVNSGDLSAAPKQLLEAREALMQIGAAETWRGIIQQYGTGSQLAAQFADKQAELNYLVSEGKITADQAAIAYADFVTSFGEYEWINDLSSAFSNFAGAALSDFNNIEDAAKGLLRQIANIILQYTILKPLENSLKSALSAGSTGGGFGASGGGSGFFSYIPKLLGFLFHNGSSSVRAGGRSKQVSAASVASAPRYHNGNLKGNELVAVLEEGEAVLRQRDAMRTANTISGLSKGFGKGMNGTIELKVTGEPGPMFVPTIRAESQNVATTVSDQRIGAYDNQQRRGGVVKNQQSYSNLKRRK